MLRENPSGSPEEQVRDRMPLGRPLSLYAVVFHLDDAAAKTKAIAYLKDASVSYWSQFDDVWFVQSAKSATEIRDELFRRTGPGGKIVVALLAGFAAWLGFDEPAESWLTQNL
jgi:hypothetical protein